MSFRGYKFSLWKSMWFYYFNGWYLFFCSSSFCLMSKLRFLLLSQCRVSTWVWLPPYILHVDVLLCLSLRHDSITLIGRSTSSKMANLILRHLSSLTWSPFKSSFSSAICFYDYTIDLVTTKDYTISKAY